jgi:DHA1 family bicyclomycin/chloramphenicol resistance-like MFS transporter
VAPDVGTLIAVRVLQGLAGAAVSVVAMAAVRDLFSGRAAAGVLSRLMLLMGTAPLIAPSIGGLVLGATSWRGIFLVLAVVAVLLAVSVSVGLPETLPPERRRSARLRETARTYRALLSDRGFVALAVVGGMTGATLLAYVSGTPFLLQEGYGMGVQGFALVFGLNAVGSLVGTQGNPLLLRRFEPRHVLTAAIAVCLVAACAMTVAAATGLGGRAAVLVPLAVILCVIGFALPNTPALALTRHGGSAGTAAAVYGATQFGLGGCAAPLVGVLGGAPGVAMAGVMTAALTVALTLLLTVVRRDAVRTATVS